MKKLMIPLFLLLVLLLTITSCSTKKVKSQPVTDVESDISVFDSSSQTKSESEQKTEVEPVAKRISENFNVFVNNANLTQVLSDGSHISKRYIKPEDELTAECENAFSSLYIKWDRVPGIYRITWNGGSLICGKNGFLHEYVRLPAEVNKISVESLTDTSLLLCDIEAYTAGSVPEDVQDWSAPCKTADILVFPTHSDDDALFFGALMSYYTIERGLTVQTAFMVEHTYNPERAHERLNGLWEMGIRHYPILGTASDTATYDMNEAMGLYASSDIPGWQIEQIRRFKPLVVVGHDLKGEYGNGGHKVNAYYLTQVMDAANNPTQYPESAEKYGVWNTPKLYLHLYEKNQITLNVTSPLQNDPMGRSPFEIAEDAFEYHVSQRKGYLRVCLNDEKMPGFDCRIFGLYHSLVGSDTKDDIMDNIIAEEWC